jgi:hypothetical protein
MAAPKRAQWRTPPLAPTYVYTALPKLFSTLGSALCGRQPYTVMEPCQGCRRRLCKISYKVAAAAALTPSDSILPSSGSEIS